MRKFRLVMEVELLPAVEIDGDYSGVYCGITGDRYPSFSEFFNHQVERDLQAMKLIKPVKWSELKDSQIDIDLNVTKVAVDIFKTIITDPDAPRNIYVTFNATWNDQDGPIDDSDK